MVVSNITKRRRQAALERGRMLRAAATTIQKHYRAARARAAVRRMRYPNAAHTSATRIQAAYRGLRGRRTAAFERAHGPRARDRAGRFISSRIEHAVFSPHTGLGRAFLRREFAKLTR